MFGNKKYINATHIRPVKSAEEIYFHFLEAMTVTLIWEKGPVSNLTPILPHFASYFVAPTPRPKSPGSWTERQPAYYLRLRGSITTGCRRPIYTFGPIASLHRCFHERPATQ